MIGRIAHHAEVVTLKGNSYRLKGAPTRLASEKPENKADKPHTVAYFSLPKMAHLSMIVDERSVPDRAKCFDCVDEPLREARVEASSSWQVNPFRYWGACWYLFCLLGSATYLAGPLAVVPREQNSGVLPGSVFSGLVTLRSPRTFHGIDRRQDSRDLLILANHGIIRGCGACTSQHLVEKLSSSWLRSHRRQSHGDGWQQDEKIVGSNAHGNAVIPMNVRLSSD